MSALGKEAVDGQDVVEQAKGEGLGGKDFRRKLLLKILKQFGEANALSWLFAALLPIRFVDLSVIA